MASLAKYTSIRLTGSSDAKYWEVTVGGQIGYIDSAVIIRDASEIEALKEDDVHYEPDPETRQAYDRAYERYKMLYTLNKPLFDME